MNRFINIVIIMVVVGIAGSLVVECAVIAGSLVVECAVIAGSLVVECAVIAGSLVVECAVIAGSLVVERAVIAVGCTGSVTRLVMLKGVWLLMCVLLPCGRQYFS